MSQQIIVLDGPDACGKTEIAKALASFFEIPYYKYSAEAEHWNTGTFKNALLFGETRQVQLLKQFCCSGVIDRGHASEFVYSQVYGRETDMNLLRKIDSVYAEMGTHIVIPLRSDYSKTRQDDLVKREMLPIIHDKYIEFVNWTNCRTTLLFVDELDNDINQELKMLLPRLT